MWDRSGWWRARVGRLCALGPWLSCALSFSHCYVVAVAGVGWLETTPFCRVGFCGWVASGPASVQLAEVCVEGARMLLPWLCEASGAKRLGPEWLVVGSL